MIKLTDVKLIENAASKSIEHIEAEMAEMEKTQLVEGPFTVAQLREMFNEIADPKDWRAPIDVNLPGEKILMACAAIEYFTATEPAVDSVFDATGKVDYGFVSSIGYRMGPAGDH